ncbi:Hypothetical predicted protein [Podarcis lilfordi]|uniref:Uncharacterized protein n=1 Tax=Podarcis lilfordi TaxID=74358 RepID=A0AA35KYZ0_9SAUR|nr:Hypothetical predicted protein [Podarcis lilfordi]
MAASGGWASPPPSSRGRNKPGRRQPQHPLLPQHRLTKTARLALLLCPAGY